MKKFSFDRRILFAAASLIMMLLLVFSARQALMAEDPYKPEDTASSLDSGRSQVYVSGDGYQLNENTKKEHKESEEQRSRILEEQRASHQQTAAQKRISDTRGSTPVKEPAKPAARPSKPSRPAEKPQEPVRRPAVKPLPPAKPSDPADNDPDDDDEENYYKKPKKERDVLPTIKTSLKDGMTTKGETISFWVTATDYKKQNIPVFSNGSGKFTVWLNGAKLTSTGESGNKTSFKPTVKNGKNTVKITAEDRRGNKRTITRRIRCEVEKELEPVGTVQVSISAPSLGIGTIASGIKVSIMEEESVAEALKKAFKSAGISATMTNSYLKGLRKSGIASKARITDELREKAEENRVTLYDEDKWPKDWKDRLFEKDFANTSGWIYRVNGEMPNVGIGAYTVNDGDEVDLVFILFDGE